MNSAAFSPDGAFLSTADTTEIRVWRLAAPELRCSARAERPAVVRHLAWDPARPVFWWVALALADIAWAAYSGFVPFGRPVPLRAIGRVYENYVQLAVHADSTVGSVADLAGRTPSLGAPCSATVCCARRA